MIHGRNLIVSIEGVAIAGAKACQIELSRQFIQACSPTESQVLDKIPTTYDWSVSADGLIPASSLTVGLEDKLIKGTKCFLTFTDGSGNKRAGFVYVKSCRESGSVGSLATFNVSFESTGALYKYEDLTTQAFAGTPNCTINVTTAGDVTWSFTGNSPLKEVATNSYNRHLFYIIANGAWTVLSSTTESNVRTYLNNQDTTSLNSKKFAAGTTTRLLDVGSGTNNYIFLTNNTTKIYVLFQ